MNEEVTGESAFPTVLVMLGATGDLARTKLIPALWDLYTQGQLPDLFQVVGFSRREWDDEEFRAHVREIVGQSGGDFAKSIDSFCQMFFYRSGLFDDREAYTALAKEMGRIDDEWRTCANKLFYLAVPPDFYKTILSHLDSSGLTEPCSPEEGWTRVVVEKPFGKDLTTAQELDGLLGKLFREEQIYRIDHYLGKDTIRNILAFRFSNAFLDPAWNSRHIDSIHINFPEEKGIGTRGAFYDGVGALRDVGQNHILQLLALFTMENPGEFTADTIRACRAQVLEQLEIMDPQEIVLQTVRGQYTGYTGEDNVSVDSQTETYFKLLVHINSTRWRGVPIYLESGKNVGESKVEVTVTFRHQTPCLCPPDHHYVNVLRYQVQPHEEMTMSFWVKRPGSDMVIEEKDFSFDYQQAYGGDKFIGAYTKLLLDVIRGDQTLFVSTAEIMASWKFIDPIEQGWSADLVPLQAYEPNTHPDFALANGDPLGGASRKMIGFIGLGKMGANMVARLVEHGWQVVAFDPDEQARASVETLGAIVVPELAQLVERLGENRTIWVMVPHKVVDGVIKDLEIRLKEGDTVIDGGNSFYKDSVLRAETLKRKGIAFLDVGVSGGPSGARQGACLMIGGPLDVYKRYTGLFADLSVAAGFGYMGVSGAGHFVKMVHNGIEYGMMQAIGEGFAVMRESSFDLNMEQVAHLYNHGSVIESSLIGWLKDAYEKYGPDLADVTGQVAHSGEGQWTVEVAKELGVPVKIIEDALQFRISSQDDPSYTGQVVSALRNMFGGHDVLKE